MWNWTRRSQTHAYKEKNEWIIVPYPMTKSHIRLEQCFECYKLILLSPSSQTLIQSFCAFLSCQDSKWQTEHETKECHLKCQFYSVLLPLLQSDPVKRQHLGWLKLQTCRQWAKVSSCSFWTATIPPLLFPSPYFLLLPLQFSASPQSPTDFKMGRHLPGHLGLWSPLAQGPERPLGLLLQIKKPTKHCL